ncbi:arylamine N-acetyltransferase [Aureibacillus halotolerans]|uniref:Arylamine N-acetyltransferase n=1 Tax=Aureibacillus halotolerans TaxID=1508390 RepID=A0A4R6UAN7_9BACI|nr:arylamine N-acetyltransferase [Aureibacillus halotolerans]TDQ42952.1 arylamine N-acetyltransferase [Aureibacillus halotolerans]
MTHKPLPQWAINYLNYIQVPIQEPSHDYLTMICTAHLNRIPFENVSTLINYKTYHKQKRLQQDEKKFVEHLFQHHMGGTCYVINSSLNQLLNQLGFHSRYTFLGGDHVALLVRVPDKQEELYVDCGNGAPFFEPIRLETDPHNVSSYGGIEVKLRPGDEPGTYTYHRAVDGKLLTEMNWPFDTRKTYRFDDFQEAIERYYKPNSLFTAYLRCQIWQLDQQRSLSLVNNVLSIRNSLGEGKKVTLANRKEVREVIDHEFHLPKLPVEKAIDVLEELGVHLFESQKTEEKTI